MTSIAAPTSLATFSTPHASSSKLPHVQLNPVHGGSGQLAVAAVQGDGVWTYDLSTLRPTTSFTVPPSTIFVGRPISFYPISRIRREKQKADEMEVDMSSEDNAQRVTCIGVHKGEGLKEEQEGKTLWIWRGEEGQSKATVVLERRIHSIGYTKNQRAPIIIAHPDGTFTALDSFNHLRPVVYTPTAAKGDSLLAFHVFQSGGLTSRVVTVDGTGVVAIIELNVGGPKEITGQVVKTVNLLQGASAESLAFAEISEDGVITGTTTANSLVSRSIKDLESSGPYPALIHPTSISPLPLPTSGKPLALIAISKPDPALLLVSSTPTLPAVLATSSLSTLFPTSSAVVSSLSLLSRPTLGVYICGVTLTYKSEEGGRSVIYTFEVTTPNNGVGMNLLLGTKSITSEYIQLAGKPPAITALDTLLSEIGETLRAGDVAGAETIFGKWLENEEKQSKSSAKEFNLPESQVKKIVQAVLDGALGKIEGGRKATGVYAPGIIGALMRKKCVHDSAYPEGLVNALIDLQDWANLNLAIRNIATIPSTSLVRTVAASIHSTPPSIDEVLRRVVGLASPPPDYRNALRSQLSVEDATAILGIYAGWAGEYVEKGGEGLRWEEKENKRQANRDSGLPPLPSVITHASHLLDSHLPLFLSHPPSYTYLENLQTSLTPLVALQESYRCLRAPVEAVLTLSRREARKQEESIAKKVALSGKKGGAGGAPGAGPTQQKGGAVGVMPQEVVGKYKVEEYVF